MKYLENNYTKINLLFIINSNWTGGLDFHLLNKICKLWKTFRNTRLNRYAYKEKEH